VHDRFEVIEELGAGGMGVVYRARDRQLGRDVALKLVHTDEDPDETLAARLMREAQALAQLSHPNVVAVYDVGRADGGVFVAMELVAGEAGDEWLRERRPWREVVRVFRDAARGLAAAHAVGLVHRDFKPANLMIGADGRVRVLDFGLARAAGFGAAVRDSGELADSDEQETRKLEAAELEPNVSMSGKPSASLLDIALTRDGAVVGTPQYMAPEQFVGAPYDARTDQFSFCIALYKALYGVRPFEGKTFGELKQNVVHGRMRTPPESDVPAWVREVAVRGLEVDPEKRWPSMDAIIEILARDPGARRRRIALAAAAVVLAGGGAAAAWAMTHDKSAVCRGSERELTGVWDEPRRGAVLAAFTKTGKPFANDAFAAVTQSLDSYARNWVAMRGEACEATRVHGTQSQDLLDLRIACLQRRLHDVGAMVDVLASADGEVVARASELTAQLPPLDACADTEALRAPVRRPTDAKTAARVDAAQKTLAAVLAQSQAGHYPAAQKLLAPLLTEATALGWRPLEGEVLLAAAQLADSTGAYPDAVKLFKDASVAAEAGRDDETAALARNGLVWVTGERLGKYDEAQDLARDAEAKVERVGHNDMLRADLDQKMSALFVEEGKYAEAEQRSQRVLELRQKTLKPDDPRIASALGDLGDVSSELSHYDAAIDYYRRALAVAQKGLAPDLSLISSLRVNLASALRYKGAIGDALEEFDKAREITERALGPDHPQLATIALDTGAAMLDAGRTGEALAQFEKARDFFTRTLGADHPNVGTTEYRIGEVELAQGHVDDAAASFQHALDIWQAKLGPDHPSLASALDGLARTQLARKHPAEAVVLYQRALANLEKALGPDHAEVAGPLEGIATCELALGKPKLAIPPLERAVALREKGDDPAATASAKALLAKARK